jgi:hypothetical protein
MLRDSECKKFRKKKAKHQKLEVFLLNPSKNEGFKALSIIFKGVVFK